MDSLIELTEFIGLSWSPDGSKIALASFDVEIDYSMVNPKIQIIDPNTKTVLIGIEKYTNAIAWKPDGSELISGGDDSLIYRWNVHNGQLINTYRHSNAPLFSGKDIPMPVQAVAYSPDGKTIASGGMDNLIHFWDVETGLSNKILDIGMNTEFNLGRAVNWLGWDKTGNRFACTNWDSILRVWNSLTEAPLLLKGHQGSLGWAAWSPDSHQIASGGLDGTIRIWDSETGELLQAIKAHSKDVGRICWSANAKYLASASANLDMTIKIWDAHTGQNVSTLLVANEVWALDWASDGRLAFAPAYQYDGYSPLPPMPIILAIDDQLPSLVIA